MAGLFIVLFASGKVQEWNTPFEDKLAPTDIPRAPRIPVMADIVAIKKPATNYRTILIAAVFHFVHQVEKDSLKHHKMTQNSLSSSYQ